MKGGYIILDIKKCQFALNEDDSEYIANNNYTKNIVNAVWNTQKPVLVENLSSLGSGFTNYKGSGFCRMLISNINIICLELPNNGGSESETSILFKNNGTITISIDS